MKFPTSFKPLVLAAALAVSGAASAAVYNLPTDGSPVVVTTGATFDDVFNFSVSSLSSLGGGMSSSPFSITFGPYIVNVLPVTFSSVKLFKGANEVSSGFAVTGTGSSTLSFSASSLAVDTYSIHVQGVSPTSIGAYAVAATLAPVPEPESYAMFLAGLGIMGAVARRRQRQG